MSPSKSPSSRVCLGLDFGTESVRALLVRLDGRELGAAVVRYPHGQITQALPTADQRLPHDFALQHPGDWVAAAAKAVRAALREAKAAGDSVVGIGVDFTSCTMLPALADGTPLCMTERFEREKYAWPKLWKHHAAKTQTEKVNAVARRRREKWLKRYGGIIGLEWFWPKVLETLEQAPQVYDATDVWIEGGDWFVWQLTGGAAHTLARSTCQAGYKAMWSAADGYPSRAFFKALHPKMADVIGQKMPGRMLAPGERAGELCATMARRFGLPAGIPVSAATIDAHAGVPGAGVGESGAMVLVMGTSSCHMLNAKVEHLVPGVAGVVDGGILPGHFGYETGQAAVGDAFDWLRRTLGRATFAELDAQAAALAPGADGVVCLDWFNGCRTPLMDGSLTGAFTGLTLNHGPHHLYRALLEASAFGVRWIVDTLRDGGVPVKRFVATGGLPHHNPLLVQIYADVLGAAITVHPCRHGPALGAAILGALAAGPKATGFTSARTAVKAMADPDRQRRNLRIVKPDTSRGRAYAVIYDRYRRLAEKLR
jgi:L-ribulokinase